MAFRQGTATDYIDLLDQLRDFLTGSASISPQSGLNWTAQRDVTYSPTERELIMRGTGAASPERPLYFGIQTYSNSGLGRFNWDVRGMTGFTDGSPTGSIAFGSQPGISPSNQYVPLQNASMPYWFYGNDKRIIMVAKTGTSYQFMYAGYLNIFGTENEYPYPICIAGSSWNVDQRFNDNTLNYSTVPHPGSQNQAGRGPVTFRFVDGVWYSCSHFSGTASETRNDQLVHPGIWPLINDTSDLSGDSNTQLPTQQVEEISSRRRNFAEQFTDPTPGGTPDNRLLQSFGSPRPTPLYPLTICGHNPSRQFYGEMDGVYWANATGGLTAEDQVIDTAVSPEVTYDVFQNVHRTDDWMYYAVKREP
jgi:hypothetical protein